MQRRSPIFLQFSNQAETVCCVLHQLNLKMEEKSHAIHQDPTEQHDSTLEDLKNSTTIDTVHNDEGVKILAQYDGDPNWSEKEEKNLRHKIDRRLLSILCTTYGLQYYDKAMLAQAVRLPDCS